MADPFPDEATIMDTDFQHAGVQVPREKIFSTLVYPAYRYVDEMSPMRIYIPSRYVMLKLIKGCLDCNTIDELWIN